MLIVSARFKGSRDQAITTAWHGESFARTKTIKPLDKYLTPLPSAASRRAKGAADVLAMFRRAFNKQEESRGHG